MEASSLGLVAVALILAVLLMRTRPQERSVYLNTLWLFLVGFVVEALADYFGWATAMTVARVVAAIAMIRLTGFFAFRLLLPAVRRPLPRIVEDLAIVGIYVVYGFVQLRGAGLDLSSLVTTSAILTAVIAFAMQDTLGNMLSGIAIQLDNSVQIGDWVQLEHVSGRVVDIRWRSTLIETRNWETVVVPNSQLMKASVSIVGRREGQPQQWRRLLDFMVDPGVPPARVISLVEDEMSELQIPNVARTPAARCVLLGFQQGNLRYQLRYFLTDLAEDDGTDSMVRVHLFATLQRAGIRIAEPQHTIHAIQRDEAHAATVRRRELTRRMQALAGISFFASLSEAERSEVAEKLQYAPFARGDVITKQGNTAHWLYIVAYGNAEVVFEPAEGTPQVIGTVGAGEIFGEMALLSGEQRSATVVAKTDVECYRLDRASFQELIATRPQIAEEVKRVVGVRQNDLEQARAAFARSGNGGQKPPAPTLVGRLQRFLRIKN
jgi:small-conductance mechanosensitive channel/CRP-like cAMP-binding protein